MELMVLRESGHTEALMGIGLSYGITSDVPVGQFFGAAKRERLETVAAKLAVKGGSHEKFLEQIVVWLDIRAPRYWWQQMDTYRIGVSKQSESTMHTATRRHLTQEDFEYAIPADTLGNLNALVDDGLLEDLKNQLPEGFLQRRIVCINYKALKNIIRQRAKHKLIEWHFFIGKVLGEVAHPEYLVGDVV